MLWFTPAYCQHRMSISESWEGRKCFIQSVKLGIRIATKFYVKQAFRANFWISEFLAHGTGTLIQVCHTGTYISSASWRVWCATLYRIGTRWAIGFSYTLNLEEFWEKHCHRNKINKMSPRRSAQPEEMPLSDCKIKITLWLIKDKLCLSFSLNFLIISNVVVIQQ